MKLSKLVPALALTALLSVGSALTLQAEDKACDSSKTCEQTEKSCCMSEKGKCDVCKGMKNLDLTDDQQQKVNAIKDSKKSEFAKIKAEAKKKATAVMEDMKKEVRKILTPEQTAKLDAMKSKKDAAKTAE